MTNVKKILFDSEGSYSALKLNIKQNRGLGYATVADLQLYDSNSKRISLRVARATSTSFQTGFKASKALSSVGWKSALKTFSDGRRSKDNFESITIALHAPISFYTFSFVSPGTHLLQGFWNLEAFDGNSWKVIYEDVVMRKYFLFLSSLLLNLE